MNEKKTYSDSMVADVMEKLNSIGINAECKDVEFFNCAIDKIREIKTSLKDELKEVADAQKKVASAEAFENGKNLAKNAKVGDIATVICGSGKFAKEYQFAIDKIGDSTITVEFTEENTPNGTTGKRYIKYDKLVSIESK